MAIAALTHDEPVVVFVPDHQRARHVHKFVTDFGGSLDRVECVIVPSNDVWVRDHGPTFVIDGTERVAIDWNFDAWGKKFPYGQDKRVAARAAARFRVPSEHADMVFEGGAIETDGQGTILTTASVALNANRNPHLKRSDVEAELTKRLGAKRIVWLESGMISDDTDGHIDTLARFTPSGVLLVHDVEDPKHPDARTLAANRAVLEGLDGWKVVPLVAATMRDDSGNVLPASYANFYIGNATVLVPAYGLTTDTAAAESVSKVFPNHAVVQVPCAALVGQGGAIHCATQQVPALPSS